ncbi:hypothetical protein PVAP13_6NG366550 [Panicum virgatum]|uniref:Uncharacterized protein n=2 Tax=Paniceae TaxID=147428 RepID=A0A8T0R576_PANVG|nr:hypothetical protein PVAP13_6NG366550 [Panicum virgatum]
MTSKTNCADPPRVRSFSIIGFTRTDCKGINVCGGRRCSFRYCSTGKIKSACRP